MIDPKTGEEITPIVNGPDDNKITESGDGTPKTEGKVEEKVEDFAPLSKEETEKLLKKANDFDGIIEKQRLDKLSKKEPEKNNEPNDEISKKLAELQAEVNSFKVDKSNESLGDAYKEFSRDFPWANSDEYFNKISEGFSMDGLSSKESVLAKLKATAINLFPTEYTQHEEKKLKSKILAENSKIALGGAGSSSYEIKNIEGGNNEDPHLVKLKERFNSSLPKGFSSK